MSQIHTRRIEYQGKRGKITLVSVIGPQKQIAELAIEQVRVRGLRSAGIICFGISDDGKNTNLVFTDSGQASEEGDFSAIVGTITKVDAVELFLPGYNYASFIANMDGGTVVSAWDTGIKIDRQTNKALQNFIEAVFVVDGNVFGTTSHTMLLLARNGERVLCACRNASTDPIVVIQTPIHTGIQVFGIIGSNIVIAAELDGQQVFATTIDKIKTYFETGEGVIWSSKYLRGIDKIEDFSLPIDNVNNTVILTAVQGGRRKLIPTVIDWNRKGFQIVLHTGDSVVEIGRTVPAPLRVDAQTGFVAARQNNGGPDRLQITTIDQFAGGIKEFADMVEKATTGGFVSAIAA